MILSYWVQGSILTVITAKKQKGAFSEKEGCDLPEQYTYKSKHKDPPSRESGKSKRRKSDEVRGTLCWRRKLHGLQGNQVRPFNLE